MLRRNSNKFQSLTKNKRYIIVVVCIGIILVISFIWILAVNLYPDHSKPYVDSPSNKSDIQPIREKENNDNRMGEENSENKDQVLPPNNILESQDKNQHEEYVVKPSQNHGQAPQG